MVLGETLEDAQAIRARLDSLVHYESAIASLSIALGHDSSGFDPDGPLPPTPDTNQSKSGRERVIALAEREGLTVRQLAQRLGGYSGLAFVGTPASVADEMQAWLDADACDGFTMTRAIAAWATSGRCASAATLSTTGRNIAAGVG